MRSIREMFTSSDLRLGAARSRFGSLLVSASLDCACAEFPAGVSVCGGRTAQRNDQQLVHELDGLQKDLTRTTQKQTDGDESSNNDDEDEDDVSQELLPADDWATRRSLWHTHEEEDPRETSGVSASVVDGGKAEDAEDEGAVCSTPGVPPPSTPAVEKATSKPEPQQQQPPGAGGQENRSPNNAAGAEHPSARKRTAGTHNAGADIRCVSCRRESRRCAAVSSD